MDVLVVCAHMLEGPVGWLLAAAQVVCSQQLVKAGHCTRCPQLPPLLLLLLALWAVLAGPGGPTQGPAIKLHTVLLLLLLVVGWAPRELVLLRRLLHTRTWQGMHVHVV
jgi:hypothetical protein